jgi:hypothetical protein
MPPIQTSKPVGCYLLFIVRTFRLDQVVFDGLALSDIAKTLWDSAFDGVGTGTI